MGCQKLIYKPQLSIHYSKPLMDKRKIYIGVYRYRFNGKEADNDIYGEGNAYDYGARIYGARLARWLSLDPLQTKYPAYSPYNSCLNNPLIFNDVDGRDVIFSPTFLNDKFRKGVWDAMASTNSVFQKHIKQFENNNNSKNLNVSVRKAQQPNKPEVKEDPFNNPLAIGAVGKPDGNNTPYEFNSSTTLKSDPVEQPTNAGGSFPVLHNVNNRAIVVNMLHEVIHATIAQEALSAGMPIPDNDKSHEIMATKYRGDILQGLKEANTDLNLGLTDEIMVDLSWSGLEGTEAFKKSHPQFGLMKKEKDRTETEQNAYSEYSQRISDFTHDAQQVVPAKK